MLSSSSHPPFQIHCSSFAEFSLPVWAPFPHAPSHLSQDSCTPLLRGVCLPHISGLVGILTSACYWTQEILTFVDVEAALLVKGVVLFPAFHVLGEKVWGFHAPNHRRAALSLLITSVLGPEKRSRSAGFRKSKVQECFLGRLCHRHLHISHCVWSPGHPS